MNLASGMRCRRLALASGLALLAGCAGMPERVPPGSTRAQIEERLGQPTAEHHLSDGTRLQYSRQPAGAQGYNLDLGPGGRLRRLEQVMDVAWLERVEVGRWTRDDVLLHLGRPAWVERVARFDGDIWTYRVIDHVWQRRVHIYLSPAGVVQQVMYSDEPMPDDRTP